MRNGSRLLFAASLVMLVAGVATFLWSFGAQNARGSGSNLVHSASLLITLIYSNFAPAAYLFFGAVLTERLRAGRDMQGQDREG